MAAINRVEGRRSCRIYTVFVNEGETRLTPDLERLPRPAWRQLFKTTEGRILLLGIAVVLVGTYIAILGWAWLLFGLYTRAAVFGPWAPALIVGTFILIVLVSYWLHHRRRKADN